MASTDIGYPKTFLGMVKVSLEKGILGIPYKFIAIPQSSLLVYPDTSNALQGWQYPIVTILCHDCTVGSRSN